jgi:predicted dehydrogenase
MTLQNPAFTVSVVGGGMITAVQLLPTLYHLQHEKRIGSLTICALESAPLKALQEDPTLRKGFPGQSFHPVPDPAKTPSGEQFPLAYREVISAMPPRNIVVVATPDHLHFEIIRYALEHDQHVLSVKPLVLKHAEAIQIEQLARKRGLLAGIEYHKRFDHRSLMARQQYRAGRFGEFRAGQAHLVECWYYRHSNFQNWCTAGNSDMFTYIGCHYVDLVAFITGLRPAGVSLYGVKEKYPNGNEGYLWTDGRVKWENGAFLSVLNGLGYPDAGPGGNSQGMTLYCSGTQDGCLIRHNDQHRGVDHSFTAAGTDPGDTVYTEPNPDYYRLLDLGNGRLTPVGYGHRSVEFIVDTIRQLERTAGDDLEKRRGILREVDIAGVIATPANSAYNELVIEAGRLSISHGGREALIEYDPVPRVFLAGESKS